MTISESGPTVTVFIPAYNASRYLPETLNSVLTQSFTDFELLVVDDGSTDDTPRVLEEVCRLDSRVRVITSERNKGRPASRNIGLRLARGQYLALMDADDYCVAERLALQVAYLDAHSAVDIVSGLWGKVDADGRPLEATDQRMRCLTPREVAARMLFDCPIHQPTIMARTAVLKQYQYDESFPVAQDHELWARMSVERCFAVLPDVLLYYRQHETQATASMQRINQARHRIHRRELQALDIEPSDEELVRHGHLFHFKGRALLKVQSGERLDAAFVAWAGLWIERLMQANQQTGRYPEPEFSDLLAARWLFVCRKAAGGSYGLRAWLALARSSLRWRVLSVIGRRRTHPF